MARSLSLLVAATSLLGSAQTFVRAQDQVHSAWFASWHAENFTLEDVSWEKYTHMTYAFAETLPSPTEVNITDPEVLPQFVQAAHDNNVKALISVGGWTGSRFWSDAVGSPENRTAFIETLLDIVEEYELDGLDFDWEYPNRQGLGCNTLNPNDTANFLEFLQELRAQDLGQGLLLSAAASGPFADAAGDPSTDVSAFAEVLDWVAIMNYDIWGSWSETVGPNAPLNDTCAPAAAQMGSAVSLVAAWSDAGIPYDQLVLGVASYGHSFAVNASSAYGNGTQLIPYATFDPSIHRQGDAWDDEPQVDACGQNQTWGGNYNFWALLDVGYLDDSGSPINETAYMFDDCSQTPFYFDESKDLMISYDDPRSLAAKGKFIKETGLKGFAFWEAGGDKNDLLLDAILSAAVECVEVDIA